MSVMSAEYHKGEGTSQKPQGEAKKLNDAQQPIEDGPVQGVPIPAEEPGQELPPEEQPPVGGAPPEAFGQDAPEGVDLTGRPPSLGAPPSGDSDLALALGPSTRPDEPVHSRNNQRQVPDYIFRALPGILRAAQEPDAPPAVRALLDLLNYHINHEGRK